MTSPSSSDSTAASVVALDTSRLTASSGLKEGLDHRGVTPGRIGCGGHCEGRNELINILFRWVNSFMYIN